MKAMREKIVAVVMSSQAAFWSSERPGAEDVARYCERALNPMNEVPNQEVVLYYAQRLWDALQD